MRHLFDSLEPVVRHGLKPRATQLFFSFMSRAAVRSDRENTQEVWATGSPGISRAHPAPVAVRQVVVGLYLSRFISYELVVRINPSVHR